MTPRLLRIAAAAALPALVGIALASCPAEARNNIRNSFFSLYPGALGTALDGLPSNTTHCGVCHLDFDGAGTRNPYGLAIQVGLNDGLTREQAILAIEGDDSDGDGFTNLVEITDVANFSNTPTFPGLTASTVGTVANVDTADVSPHVTPSGGSDTTPPVVTVTAPTGGEVLAANATTTVSWTAEDPSGIASVRVLLSDDSGATWKRVSGLLADTGSFSWFVPNRPGAQSRVRVEAIDAAGNPGHGDSPGDFTITQAPGGRVPTTLRDMDLAGTQPHEGAILDDVEGSCGGCHGGYDDDVEPQRNWRGSMMGQAMRDPLFLACLTVAEQDAPSVGDLCLRCHTPGGWQEGRSVDTSGGQITAKDRLGVQCDFCHRQVDPDYDAGVDPVEDVAILAALDAIPLAPANGQFIQDPAPVRRGPFADAEAPHAFLESAFHRSSDVCGTCHDVSNPVFVSTPDGYAPNGFDADHPDGDLRNMFPIERTYSEWSASEYAASGVYAPQFAGNRPDGIVSTCQDCHMRDVAGRGAIGGPVRQDLPLHDFTGGNAFIPDVLLTTSPGEVDPGALAAAKQRAIDMLQLAATLEGFPEDFGLTVRVTNETAHKLPSGYPEGRRTWLEVVAVDAAGAPVFHSGAYDAATGTLTHDAQVKIWEIEPGLSPGLAAALGLPAGPSFHFVLNDTVWSDNRIPPRGFTNAAFEAIQSAPVAHAYADGQYWDDTAYFLPAAAETAHVTLWYQTTSREYVEFLRDENVTDTRGQEMYDAWVLHGRGAPVAMGSFTLPLGPIGTGVDGAPGGPAVEFALAPGRPNPTAGPTTFRWSVPEPVRVQMAVYDPAGRLVRRLEDGDREAGRYETAWDGRNENGRRVSAGLYFCRLTAGGRAASQRVMILR